MNHPGSSFRTFKLAAIAAAIIIGVLGLTGTPFKVQKISASVNGPAPSHTNAPGEGNCTECHVDFPLNSGGGNLSIAGIPANYKPGQQIPITVKLNQADAVAYGFQLTAIDSSGRPAG